MFRGFIEKSYTEFTKKQIYLRPAFQALANRGKIILDQDLVDQLNEFVLQNINQGNADKIHQFVQLFEVQLILPPHITEMLIANSLKKLETPVKIYEQPLEMGFEIPEVQNSKSKTPKSPELVIPSQFSFQIISEKSTADEKILVTLNDLKQFPLGKSRATVKGRLISKPVIEKNELEVLGEFAVLFKDNSASCQFLFIRQRLKATFAKLFNELKIQSIYEISNFETHLYKGKFEIKVTSETQFTFCEDYPIEQQLSNALQSDTKNGEEISVPAIIAEISQQKQINKRLLLYCINPNSQQPLKISLILWDQYKDIQFKVGQICIFEGVQLKLFGETLELKSIRTRFNFVEFNTLKLQAIKEELENKKKKWLNIIEEVQIEEQKGPSYCDNIHKKSEGLFNTVVKILKDRPPIFSLKQNLLIKEIIVTSDNTNTQSVSLLGERLCSKYFSEGTIIFITHLQYQGEKIQADENQTQIRVLDDDNDFQTEIKLLKQQFSRPQILSQDLEIEEGQLIDDGKQLTKNAPIKVKIALKGRQSEGQLSQIKEGLKMSDFISETITLLEGKNLKSKFNTIVQIDDLYEVRYQKGSLKSQDIKISDDTYRGRLTLWNNQIGDFRKDQTIRIDNIYYDEVRQEFKTSQGSKVDINVPQKNMRVSNYTQQEPLTINGQTFQEFRFNVEVKLLNDILKLSQSSNEELPYQYCRGTISAIMSARLAQRCPTCKYSKLTQIGDAVECSGQLNVKHVVSNPKISCFLKCKLVDFTAAIEAIFFDDLCEQFVPQKTMVELYKNEQSILPYFDFILHREFTFKINLSKSKDQSQCKFKIIKIFKTNYLKSISTYVQ